MARDYEDVHDLDDLSDDELRALVRSKLRDHRGVDDADVTITVEDGCVSIAGRVGTEDERRIAEHIITDVIGVDRMENELVVDAMRRAQSPEAMDDHIASEEEHEGLLLGDRPRPLSPEAEHLSDELDDELLAFGTTDVQKTIQGAVPWIPPERPTPEGYDVPIDDGEDH
ncbi:MAG TPA: BON domain-containing protein [Gemmatimonadaceae bacterium]|nr:BON domain-containing protein [Gemmatimonadaceae bacterium]